MTQENRPRSLTRRTLLLVDDEQMVLDGMRRVLRHEPYEILTAPSGEEGWEVLTRHEVDAVIADHQMTGMTGTTFLSRVRTRFPDTLRFLLTGKATLEVAIAALNEGGVMRFFEKPCPTWELILTLKQGFQQRDLQAVSRRLLARARGERARLQRLELAHPGITHVSRDSDGTLVIDQSPGDYDALVKEIQVYLDEKEQKLPR